MRWGLSWGAQAPHHLIVEGIRYEIRTTCIANDWTAYGTVNGVCLEAKGATEREARQKWQTKVEAMSPLHAVERRVELALDEAAAALEDATQTVTAADSPGSESPANPSESTATSDAPPQLLPETCENLRSIDRRLRPRLRRER